MSHRTYKIKQFQDFFPEIFKGISVVKDLPIEDGVQTFPLENISTISPTDSDEEKAFAVQTAKWASMLRVSKLIIDVFLSRGKVTDGNFKFILTDPVTAARLSNSNENRKDFISVSLDCRLHDISFHYNQITLSFVKDKILIKID